MRKYVPAIIIAGVVALVIGGVVLLGMAHAAETEKIMKSGVDTAAIPVQVVKEDHRRKVSGTKNTYRTITDYHAEFIYNVNDKEYTINSEDFKGKDLASKYLQAPHSIRYLEEDPDEARIIDLTGPR